MTKKLDEVMKQRDEVTKQCDEVTRQRDAHKTKRRADQGADHGQMSLKQRESSDESRMEIKTNRQINK